MTGSGGYPTGSGLDASDGRSEEAALSENRQRIMERTGEALAPEVDGETTQFNVEHDEPPTPPVDTEPAVPTSPAEQRPVEQTMASAPPAAASAPAEETPAEETPAKETPAEETKLAPAPDPVTAPAVPPEQHANAPADSVPGGAPPWQRAMTAGSAQKPPVGSSSAGSAQKPPVGSSSAGSAQKPPAESASQRLRGFRSPQTYAFSQGPAPALADQPTSYVPPVTDPLAEDRPGAASTGGIRTTGSTRLRPGRMPRRASLQIKRFDPWSVLKLALVLSVALFLVWLVAVGVLYGVLDGMGVWDKLNGTYSDLVSVNGQDDEDVLISAGRVFGVAAVVGAVNIVLLTAFVTVGAFIYNASADLAGGIEVTLSERD